MLRTHTLWPEVYMKYTFKFSPKLAQILFKLSRMRLNVQEHLFGK